MLLEISRLRCVFCSGLVDRHVFFLFIYVSRQKLIEIPKAHEVINRTPSILLFYTMYMHQASTIPTDEYSLSFTEFADFLTEFSIRQEISHSERFCQLYRTQMELSLLYRLFATDFNVTVRFYLEKASGLIDTEIKLVYFMVEHPESQLSQQEKTLSTLHWKGSLANLMELITSLDYSEMIVDVSGRHQSFAGLASAFERLFNISISKPYDLRADLYRRKKNLSVLLPKLIEVYEKNIVNRGIGK